MTTASTGEGVPELLAALDRHRATDHAAETGGARRTRAEAQVWAILGERLRARLVAPARRAGTEAILEDVAAHRLDPYAAADRLLRDRPGRDDGDGAAALVHARVRRAVRGRARVLHRPAARSCRSRPGSPPARSAPTRPASASRSASSRSRRSCSARVVGWASDRFGRRPLLVFGGVAHASSALVFHLVVDDAAAVRRRAARLLGIAEAFFFVAARRGRQRPGAARTAAARRSTRLARALPGARDRAVARGDDPGRGLRRGLARGGRAHGRRDGPELLVPETAPGELRQRRDRRATAADAADPPGRALPGLLILCGVWGMAGVPRVRAAVRDATSGIGGAGPGARAVRARRGRASHRVRQAARPARRGAALGASPWSDRRVGLAIARPRREPGPGCYVGTVVFAARHRLLRSRRCSRSPSSRVDETERGTVVGTTTVFLDLSFGLAPAVLGLAVGGVGLRRRRSSSRPRSPRSVARCCWPAAGPLVPPVAARG